MQKKEGAYGYASSFVFGTVWRVSRVYTHSLSCVIYKLGICTVSC